MRTVTIDTTVVRDLEDPARPRHRSAVRLVDMHEKGQIDIAVTTRINIDVSGPLREKLDALPALRTAPIGTGFRLDYSTLNCGDMLVDDDTAQEPDEIMELLFPGADPTSHKHQNRIADVDHLLGHKLNGRDVFLTDDRAILDRRSQLHERFGIVVMTPNEFLESCSET